MRISAFNRSCERKQSHIYQRKKVAIRFDHEPILFSAANPADEVFGSHRTPRYRKSSSLPLRTELRRNECNAIAKTPRVLALIDASEHGALNVLIMTKVALDRLTQEM
jgi:hypothetical protein